MGIITRGFSVRAYRWEEGRGGGEKARIPTVFSCQENTFMLKMSIASWSLTSPSRKKSSHVWKDACKYGSHRLRCWNVWETLALLGPAHRRAMPGRHSLTASATFTPHCLQAARVHVDSHFTGKAAHTHQKSRKPTTAWSVQVPTSPPASLPGHSEASFQRQRIREGERCKRQKDSWLPSKVSVSVDRRVSSSVIWAGKRDMGCPKELVLKISPKVRGEILSASPPPGTSAAPGQMVGHTSQPGKEWDTICGT